MKRNTRKDIILTAIDLMGQFGLKAVTMKQLAEAVGIRAGSLTNYFERKEDLLDGMLDYLNDYLQVLVLEPDEILDLLRTKTPEQIFQMMIDYYQDEDDTHRLQLYRLLFRNQYQHEKLREAANHFFFTRPANTLLLTMETMAQAGAIPSGDFSTLAMLWQATSIVFGILATHDCSSIKIEDYLSITQFFIAAAVRGVTPITINGLEKPNSFRFVQSAKSDIPYTGTKRNIVYWAYELFSKEGYENITLRDIADAAGIKASSFYNYYPSKEALVQEIGERIVAYSKPVYIHSKQIQAAMAAADPEQLWNSLSGCHIDMNDDSIIGYRLIFREQYNSVILRDFYWKSVEEYINAVTEGLGELSHCNTRQIATIYIYTMCALHINATLSAKAREELEENRMKIGRWLIGFILNGYDF